MSSRKFQPTQYTDAYFFAYLARKPQPRDTIVTYYLQYGLTNDRPETPSGLDIEPPRFFIDEKLHKFTFPCAQVEATTWLDARNSYELTNYTPGHYGVFTTDTATFLKLLKEYNAATPQD
jgi:hypothetical protein